MSRLMLGGAAFASLVLLAGCNQGAETDAAATAETGGTTSATTRTQLAAFGGVGDGGIVCPGNQICPDVGWGDDSGIGDGILVSTTGLRARVFCPPPPQTRPSGCPTGLIGYIPGRLWDPGATTTYMCSETEKPAGKRCPPKLKGYVAFVGVPDETPPPEFYECPGNTTPAAKACTASPLQPQTGGLFACAAGTPPPKPCSPARTAASQAPPVVGGTVCPGSANCPKE